MYCTYVPHYSVRTYPLEEGLFQEYFCVLLAHLCMVLSGVAILGILCLLFLYLSIDTRTATSLIVCACLLCIQTRDLVYMYSPIPLNPSY